MTRAGRRPGGGARWGAVLALLGVALLSGAAGAAAIAPAHPGAAAASGRLGAAGHAAPGVGTASLTAQPDASRPDLRRLAADSDLDPASVLPAGPLTAMQQAVSGGPDPETTAPAHVAVVTGPSAGTAVGGSAATGHGSSGIAADPHRLVTPGLHPPASDAFSPDDTPVAAAAGNEPGSVAPVDLLAGWSSTVHRFRFGGLQRSYLLVRPTKPSASPLPVVLVLHGRGLTPASIERITGMWAATGPAIQVYPAGYGRSWNAGGCCGQAYLAHVDDVGFLRTVVQQVLSTQHDADAGRVDGVGFSNGGRMAFRLACAVPRTLTAVVAVEAVPVDSCDVTTPLPLLVVANRHDPLLAIDPSAPPKVIYDSIEPTVTAVVAHWRGLDGCSPVAATDVVGRLTVSSWQHCVGAGRVALAEYASGGHSWSTGGPATPAAQQVVWGFLTGQRPLAPAGAGAAAPGGTAGGPPTT